ncbi:hypothetical protein ACOTTU_07395 [Roseobacter sp. EG26]|uniref:hypothetical protein n=1 Tax=Roseobacter sp. EG26 TaxID=3412477 RepID=UPI003CE4ADF4
MRRWFLLGAISCLTLLPTIAVAQAVKLKPHEISALLMGNTAVGKWQGVRYRQYFAADGVTLFAQQGIRTARGKWRVDSGREEYQSRWPGDAAWEGWFVMEWDGDFYWVSKSTPPTPFRVEQGQRLDWPDQ